MRRTLPSAILTLAVCTVLLTALTAPALAAEPATATPDGADSGAAGATGDAANAASDADAERRVSQQVADAIAAKIDEHFPIKASYGSKGFRLETRDGKFQTNLQWRFQFRFTNPYIGDPRSVSAFGGQDEASFQARRLRMKIGGHGYQPWLEYYFELDMQPTRDSDDTGADASARVIDWRVDVAKYEAFGIRVGQWKIDYNRERVDSSGRQQFVERSIVNRAFTIDRQMGVSFRGHLFRGTPGDFRYYVGVFTGEGRGVANDDNHLMYVGRLQWNFLGRDLGLRQTDVERTEKPTASLAVGAATHRGKCTRWSSSGCGNLDGFTKPADAATAQFDVRQVVGEFAFKYQGLAIQKEFHWKRVVDRMLAVSDPEYESDLYGGYGQIGYFFNEIIDTVPEELEMGFRYAYVREPNATDRTENNVREEYSAVANWFFSGHNNKITLDYSYLTLCDGLTDEDVSDHRVRLQWDISF